MFRSRHRLNVHGFPLVLALTAVLLVAACDGGQSDTPVAPVARPVVVFADIADKAYLPSLFAAYTLATGVAVTVRHADTDTLIEDVVGNRVSPPADLLWLGDASGLWRAVEEGALRPLGPLHVEADVPKALSDPDNSWIGISFRLGLIVVDAGRIDSASADDYAELGGSRFRSLLCLSSSAEPINRRVLSTLIDSLQIRRTERIVRGWVANLAQPVFASEAQLLDALGTGACAVGIASSTAFSIAAQGPGLQVRIPDRAAIDVEGAGIARHAQNPDGAARLLDWLSSEAVQTRHAASRGTYPVHPDARLPAGLPAADRAIAGMHSVTALGRLAGDAALLAERTRYRE